MLGLERREEAKHYRCMFTTFQFASVLQHGMDHIPCPCSLPVRWGHVQEVLRINTFTTQTKQRHIKSAQIDRKQNTDINPKKRHLFQILFQLLAFCEVEL